MRGLMGTDGLDVLVKRVFESCQREIALGKVRKPLAVELVLEMFESEGVAQDVD